MELCIQNDAWGLIKSYLFHGKFEAINIIKYHTELPYTIGLHNHKGVENTLQYLWDHHNSIFKVLSVNQVRDIITCHNNVLCKVYT